MLDAGAFAEGVKKNRSANIIAWAKDKRLAY